ncbi:hypothetical protein VE03_04511 [Pseudogymnoascus sp. 23342-1-I1]|nr:hypothetical protein VE03_04511 [Pseudogymnoascus sp. 23342-1-I1]
MSAPTTSPPAPAPTTTPGALPTPKTHLRLARPSLSLPAAEKFYVHGLGLSVLYRSPPQGTHPDQHPEDLIMLGYPSGGWHLELVHGVGEAGSPFPVPKPTEEDLLVLYVEGPVDQGLVDRMVEAGGRRVVARNGYWERWGVMVKDPDGYGVVLCTRGWENVAVE